MSNIGYFMDIIKSNFGSDLHCHISENGDRFVHMMDLAAILMLPKNSRDILTKVSAEYRFKLAVGVGKPAWWLSEPGVYQLIFTSDHPKAVEIQRWVFEEVLPGIRKTGVYATDEAKQKITAILDGLLTIHRTFETNSHLINQATSNFGDAYLQNKPEAKKLYGELVNVVNQYPTIQIELFEQDTSVFIRLQSLADLLDIPMEDTFKEHYFR